MDGTRIAHIGHIFKRIFWRAQSFKDAEKAASMHHKSSSLQGLLLKHLLTFNIIFNDMISHVFHHLLSYFFGWITESWIADKKQGNKESQYLSIFIR